ncbi:MAG: helix-turn-helix transcriptional regulator [Bacteroidota bacterium]
MITYQETRSSAQLYVCDKADPAILHLDTEERLFTIFWNKSGETLLEVDTIPISLKDSSILFLTPDQKVHLKQAGDLQIIRFNREFYCIVDHDEEVSCVGVLFFNSNWDLSIKLDRGNHEKLDLLLKVFGDELATHDKVQGEMLRMLLTRFIIICTRLHKSQHAMVDQGSEKEWDLIRNFHLQLERNFKKLHQVQDYADLLNRSPKTLTNIFKKYNVHPPLKIIHERLILEAKRLLIYTDMSIKEVAYELGFEEVSHFNRIFKKIVEMTPSLFVQKYKEELSGKIDKSEGRMVNENS